ncbi:caspase family protein [Gemmobacter caeruleus]|uniref:caspase family protein n=1 Tax=Gemmobacter caeruleus TaxID=2595004 RepID=UPI0011EC6A40|nr:caspase family protein [Gemmobacter caeruleus]
MRWLFFLLALCVAIPAQAAQRFALVIGIDDYTALTDLQKARNDARAVAGSLEQLGYSVSLLIDADRRGITRGVSDLAGRLGPGDEVLFYFAGHGIQIDGRNFLIPSDAPAAGPEDEAFLTAESIAVDQVLDTFQTRGAATTVLILDACRDNPFPKRGTRSVGSGRGLAPAEPTEGSFILFSAGSGQTALDRLSDSDADPNSVFTRNLLPFLNDPDEPLQDIVRDLRREVEAQAASIGHRQRPAYYDELTGDYVLTAARPVVAPAPVVAVPAPQPETPCAIAERDWVGVEASNSPELLRAFAAAHFGCETLRNAALQRLESLSHPTTPERVALPAPEQPAPEPPPAIAAAPVAAAPAPQAPAPDPEAVAKAEAEARAKAEAEARVALASAVQTELKRLKCYTGAIDGDWGKGSRAALARFVSTNKQSDPGAEPTEAVLAMLKAPDLKACPAVVAKPRVAKPAPTQRSATVKPAATGTTAKAAPKAEAKPAAKAGTTTGTKKPCGKLYVLPFPKPIDMC